jgi:peroxiredoxin
MATIDPPNIADVAPDFTVPDANEIRLHLAELCAEKPLVLVFYRGHW